LPVNVTYALSSDGENFTQAASIDHPEDREAQVKFVPITYRGTTPMKARYIKVTVTGTKVCPHWHYGVGHPCWFFMDEVVVR
jgi:hypothetical protein